MKRGGPLKRRTPLARIGRKKRRELPDEQRARANVASRRFCQAPAVAHTLQWHAHHVWARHLGAHAHHVWPEDRDCGRHDPARMLWLCADSHRWVHAHPLLAKELGLLRATDPAVW